MNCLSMRRYLKTLFAPDDDIPIALDSNESSDDEPEVKDNWVIDSSDRASVEIWNINSGK